MREYGKLLSPNPPRKTVAPPEQEFWEGLYRPVGILFFSIVGLTVLIGFILERT